MPEDIEEHGADVSDAALSENEDESETYSKEHNTMIEQSTGGGGSGEPKKKYDPKDPSRPRRKKARRACFACQRAHLTCGDERPCQRCVKRGLAENCQDGVRKKAKYLHDAPPEALGPVLGPNFNSGAGSASRPHAQRQNSSPSDAMSATPNSNFFPTGSGSGFPLYQGQAQSAVALPDGLGFGSQPASMSPSFQNQATNGNAQMDPMLPTNDAFNAMFDPSNPALYNFDLEGLNFGSQYAGWEFGILNKMGLGAETPPRENSISQTPTSEYANVFGNGAGSTYDGNNILAKDYSSLDPQQQQVYHQGNLQHGLPHAFAIAAGPTSLASPSTEATASPQPTAMADGSPGNFGSSIPVNVRIKSKQLKPNQSILGKRQRDAASIYESVKKPYPYTTGFHNMVSVLRKRLPGDKLLAIAKALGEIRPSFIASTKDLTEEDLVFMEKCFQRTLVEFDDFLNHNPSPTIVCRRSGEVAAVNKEFISLTGWTKDVLLGKEPNRHVHIRSNSTGSSQEGADPRPEASVTPRVKNATLDTGRLQPVFLAELLDDDSVVRFYKDFSQLAFEDSRGKVTRTCKLVKYRPEEPDVKPHKDPRTGMLSSRVTMIDGEHGISRIEQDGKVNCAYCWTIKRDMFDIPMMIIINFLPRYSPDEEHMAV